MTVSGAERWTPVLDVTQWRTGTLFGGVVHSLPFQLLSENSVPDADDRQATKSSDVVGRFLVFDKICRVT